MISGSGRSTTFDYSSGKGAAQSYVVMTLESFTRLVTP